MVDTTEALSEHHVYFERLARLPQVTGVVLVAVGGIAGEAIGTGEIHGALVACRTKAGV